MSVNWICIQPMGFQEASVLIHLHRQLCNQSCVRREGLILLMIVLVGSRPKYLSQAVAVLGWSLG